MENAAVVKIEGAVDVYSVSALGEAIQSLIAEGFRQVVVDLEEVPAVDSSGIGTLVGNSKSIGALDGKIWLVAPNDRIRRMLEITGLSKYFEIRSNSDEALSEIGIAQTCETVV